MELGMEEAPEMTDQDLIAKAQEVLHYRELSNECVAGEVSAALLTEAEIGRAHV